MSEADFEPQTGNIEQTEIDISVVVPFYNAQKHIEECARARDRGAVLFVRTAVC